jgi:hypothetical protein
MQAVGWGLLPPFKTKTIAPNGSALQYPKGKMFHFGFAFYNMKQIEKKMQNYLQ